MPARCFPNLLIAEQRTRGAAVFGVLRALGMTLGTLVPAALGLGLGGIVVGLIAFGALQAAGMAATVAALYRRVDRAPSPISAGELFRFSFPLGMTDIVNTLNVGLDRYLILFVMGEAALAEYVMGAWQIPLVTSIAYSVGHVYMPRFVRLFKEGRAEEAIAIWRASIQKVSLIVVPVCAIFVVGAEPFVSLAFTSRYAAAAPIFRLYCILTMARVASFGSMLVAAGRPGWVLRASFASLLSNLVLSVPLVLVMGFVGPALGTVLAFIPTVAAYCWAIARASGQPANRIFPLFAYLKVVSVVAVPSLVAAWLQHSVLAGLSPAVSLLTTAAIILGGYAVVGTMSGQITRSDWGFASRWIRLKILSSPG